MVIAMTAAGAIMYAAFVSSGESRWFAAGMALVSAATVLVLSA